MFIYTRLKYIPYCCVHRQLLLCILLQCSCNGLTLRVDLCRMNDRWVDNKVYTVTTYK